MTYIPHFAGVAIIDFGAIALLVTALAAAFVSVWASLRGKGKQ